MKRPIGRNFSYRRRYAEVFGLTLIIAYGICALGYDRLPYRPYPLFPWDLYSSTPGRSEYFDIVVRALEPGKALKREVFLADLHKEYHEDWALAPKKLIQRFGREFMLDSYSAEAIKTHKLIDNFLLDYPYAQYDLVHVSYDPYELLNAGQYTSPADLPVHVIHSFFRSRGGLP